jgi:phenylacetate-CoA ligase
MQLAKLILNARVYFTLRTLLRNFPYHSEVIQAQQWKKLKALLQHCYEHHSFYRQRMDDAWMPPDKFHSLDDLNKLPVLTKDEYRQWVLESYNRRPSRYQNWYRDGTSGSTGVPLTIYRPWKEQAYIIAKWLRELVVNGYRPLRQKTFCLVSPHRLSKHDSLLQSLGLFRRERLSYLASPKEMVEALNHARPDLFYANKSQFVQMATYAKEHFLELYAPPLYACGAETIDDTSRRIIYDAFGEDGFFETYGCVELGVLAFQEKQNKSFLHFCHDTNVLELVNGRTATGTEGYCVVTDLYQYAFPLIRYNLGDYLVTEEHGGLRVIRRICGRQDDWIVFADGARIPFHSFYEIMEKRSTILQFRVIQETHDMIRMLCVARVGIDRDETRRGIIDDMKKYVRADIHYQVDFADAIPPDANGKLRMLISNVSQVRQSAD